MRPCSDLSVKLILLHAPDFHAGLDGVAALGVGEVVDKAVGIIFAIRVVAERITRESGNRERVERLAVAGILVVIAILADSGVVQHGRRECVLHVEHGVGSIHCGVSVLRQGRRDVVVLVRIEAEGYGGLVVHHVVDAEQTAILVGRAGAAADPEVGIGIGRRNRAQREIVNERRERGGFLRHLRAIGVGGHIPADRLRERLPDALVVHEDEQFVVDDRAAEAGAEVIHAERREAGRIEGIGVEKAVTQIFVGGAMEIVGAASWRPC